jgi:hypothetical protein
MKSLIPHSIWNHAKHCISLFRTSVVIFAGFLLALRLAFIADDPPRFPLPSSADPTDCFSFTSTKIWAESSRVKVSVEIGDFVEYPREIASTLLTVVVTGGNFTFSYPSWQFWDLISDLSHMSFCILQAAGGRGLNCSLYCHGHLLATNTFDLAEIEVSPVGWSRMVSPADLVARFRDVCIDASGRIVFFTRAEAVFPSLHLTSDFAMPIVINANATESYCQIVNGTYERSTTLFISDVASTASEALFRIVLPLFGAYFHSFQNTDYEIVLVRPDLQRSLIPSIQPLLRREIRYLKPDVCYSKALFPRSPGFLWPYTADRIPDEADGLARHFKYVLSFRTEVADLARTMYGGGEEISSGRVVLDESLAGHAPAFQRACDECEFIVLNESLTVPEAARLIASAHVFVGGTLFADLFAMFMHRDATFIEVPTDGNECTTFGKKYAPPKYIAAYEAKECNCDVRCYLAKPIAHKNMNDTQVGKAIARGVAP